MQSKDNGLTFLAEEILRQDSIRTCAKAAALIDRNISKGVSGKVSYEQSSTPQRRLHLMKILIHFKATDIAVAQESWPTS